jgi:hypothetical protein
LYADRALKNEKLSVRPILQKSKNTNMAGGWRLKFTFSFMETTQEQFHLDKWSSVQWKLVDMRTKFIWIIFFDESIK